MPREVILQSVRWHVSYRLSYRDLEEIMAERGLPVDHSTLNRWVLHYSPLLEREFRKYKRAVGKRWRMDETYVKVRGEWKYYYRAMDKADQTIDFLLTLKRDKQAAIKQYNTDHNKRIKIRQCKHLNNLIEQDHRRIKRITWPMIGFKNFYSAQKTLAVCSALLLSACNNNLPAHKNNTASPTDVQQHYSEELAHFIDIRVGDPKSRVTPKIKNFLQLEDTGQHEGNKTVNYNEHKDKNGTITVIASINNALDDSVQAMELKATFDHDDRDYYILVAYGLRLKCYRGENPGEWTTELCP